MNHDEMNNDDIKVLTPHSPSSFLTNKMET